MKKYFHRLFQFTGYQVFSYILIVCLTVASYSILMVWVNAFDCGLPLGIGCKTFLWEDDFWMPTEFILVILIATLIFIGLMRLLRDVISPSHMALFYFFCTSAFCFLSAYSIAWQGAFNFGATWTTEDIVLGFLLWEKFFWICYIPAILLFIGGSWLIAKHDPSTKRE